MSRSYCGPALLCVLGAAMPSLAQAQDAPAPAAAVRPFDFTAAVSASETYTSNSAGLSAGSNSDFISTIGFNAAIHDKTRTLSLDATYSFGASFYAKGTQSAQIINNLAAVGTITAIPDHLVISGKAFAAPVIRSNVGIVTAGNRVVANGYSDSYGYSIAPDLRFRFGQFATSDTIASYSASYFTNPSGSGGVVIPGLAGPEDTTSRALQQTFASGEDFSQFGWSLNGIFNETKRKQGLLSEKAGTANLRYAFGHEFALLGTVGYEAITATVPLTRNVSGVVALGGFSLTFGQDFSLMVEAGRKFNNASYLGSLRYNLTPTASIVAAVNDTVTTPEGQLLDSLSNLVTTPEGTLTSSQNLLGNGTAASQPTFSPQAPGSFAFDQNISRYQTVNISFLEDFERNHAAVQLFASRRTILSGVFLGPPVTESWGGHLTYARNISPRTLGSVGGSYVEDQQLGGNARTFRIEAQVGYAVSREMQLYMRTDYLDRHSSAALSGVSIFTGSLTDYEIAIGVSRTL